MSEPNRRQTATKAQPIHRRVTLRRVTRAIEQSMEDTSNPGFCIACGAEAEGCEPDAREYPCSSCQARAVYGAEELLIMLQVGK